jgi:hypothetical protein
VEKSGPGDLHTEHGHSEKQRRKPRIRHEAMILLYHEFSTFLLKDLQPLLRAFAATAACTSLSRSSNCCRTAVFTTTIVRSPVATSDNSLNSVQPRKCRQNVHAVGDVCDTTNGTMKLSHPNIISARSPERPLNRPCSVPKDP